MQVGVFDCLYLRVSKSSKCVSVHLASCSDAQSKRHLEGYRHLKYYKVKSTTSISEQASKYNEDVGHCRTIPSQTLAGAKRWLCKNRIIICNTTGVGSTKHADRKEKSGTHTHI